MGEFRKLDFLLQQVLGTDEKRAVIVEMSDGND